MKKYMLTNFVDFWLVFANLMLSIFYTFYAAR